MSTRLLPPLPTRYPLIAPTPAPSTVKAAVAIWSIFSKPLSLPPAAVPTAAPAPAPTPRPIKVGLVADFFLTSKTLRTSSLFKSTGAPLTASDIDKSETLLSFPSTVFPVFSFMTSLLPVVTDLSTDQSLVVAAAFCADKVTDDSNSDATSTILIANFFLRGYTGSLLMSRWINSKSALSQPVQDSPSDLHDHRSQPSRQLCH